MTTDNSRAEGPLRRLGRGVTARSKWLGPPGWILLIAIVAWIEVFSYLCILRQARFNSPSFDTGIYDQAIWLIAHGRPTFITVRGLAMWGQHVNVGLYLLAPFYWLGAGPNFINIVQVSAEAGAAIPLYLFARWRLESNWGAAALGVAWLAHPALQFFAWEQFHPEVIAMLPLMAAYYFGRRQRWWQFAIAAVLAAIWKEDVALAVTVLGLAIAYYSNRKVGLVTAGIAFGWFVLSVLVILPANNPGGAFYTSEFFSYLGNSAGSIVFNAVRHPSVVWRHLVNPVARTYFWQLFAPTAFLALLAPITLVIAVPQLLIDVMSAVSWTRTIQYHYAAIPLVAIALASVEAIAVSAKLWRRDPAIIRRALCVVVLGVSLATSVLWGVSPVSKLYRAGFWPLGTDVAQAVQNQAVAMVPPNAVVAASYTFVAHLSHRVGIYAYPNPWKDTDWGNGNRQGLPSTKVVQWLVIDKATLGRSDLSLLNTILSTRAFTVVLNKDSILVAHRTNGSAGGTSSP